jgi:hypothetical protein
LIGALYRSGLYMITHNIGFHTYYRKVPAVTSVYRNALFSKQWIYSMKMYTNCLEKKINIFLIWYIWQISIARGWLFFQSSLMYNVNPYPSRHIIHNRRKYIKIDIIFLMNILWLWYLDNIFTNVIGKYFYRCHSQIWIN